MPKSKNCLEIASQAMLVGMALVIVWAFGFVMGQAYTLDRKIDQIEVGELTAADMEEPAHEAP